MFFLDPIELSMLAFVFLTNVARWRFHCAADLPTSSMKKFSVQVFHDQTEALNCEEESGKQLLQAALKSTEVKMGNNYKLLLLKTLA